MRIQVLGSVEANNGAEIALGGPTQRRILAMLALDAGDVVSVDRLVDAIWTEDELPANPERNIRSYVHRLRTSLGEDLADRVETAPPGYRLRLDDGELDARRFEDLSGTAGRQLEEGDAVAALATFQTAESLWRGRPFGEFADEQWALAEGERLTEIHLGNRERRIASLIELGQAQTGAAEAEALARELPLREGPRALLMRSLYHSGRQAEALRAFQEYRTLLIDEIGVQPSEDLAALDQAIAAGELEEEAASVGSRRVGSYDLHERIGEGAFAVVYRGTQAGLDRDVALKAIRAELANRPDFIRNFEAEAQLVAHLEHPHIVPLYDFWREPDKAFLVMRWLPGGTLEQALADGPWPIEKCTRMVEEVGSALALAHRNGVVHRDVKPANILLDDEGNSYLTDFGIALLVEAQTDTEVTPDLGTTRYAAPEQIRKQSSGPATDVYGLAIAAFAALTADFPFADSSDSMELTRRQLSEPIPHVANAAAGLSVAVDDVLQKATAKDPADRYEEVSDFVNAFVGAAASGVDPAARTAVTVRRPSAETENPYKGLRPFGEGDSDDFFGRDKLVHELVASMTDRDQEAHLLAVIGPSGSGKSSLVHAGLVPALRRGAVPGSDDWFVSTMVPGVDPFENLETALLRVAVNPPTSLRDQLADGPRGILRSVRRVLPDDSSPLLLVLDQFEELFTLCEDDQLRHDFLSGLAVAASEPASPLRVVLTLRADFYDRPLRHAEFAPLIKQNSVTVTPLSGDELERAIVEPAAGVGAQYEPGLVADIIADVGSQPGALPLLQYALTELFETNVSGLLRSDSYRELGGMTGALARRADDLYLAGTSVEQDATRRLFGRLISLGEGNEDTRRRVRMAEITSDPATESVIARYGDARLLTFDNEAMTREPTVEVAHEALIREWPRLRVWLEDDRQSLRLHRHLTTTATAWDERGRDDGDLYRGVRLDAATTWIEADGPALNSVESDFVAASRQRREAELEDEKRRTRRLRRLLVTTAVVAVIALVAGSFAIREQRRADDQTTRAEENAAVASEQADEAAASADLADQAAQDAQAAQAAGEVERLRAVAEANAPTTSETAALLAVEAYLLDPSRESLDTLHKVLTARPGFKGNIEAGPYSNGELLEDGVTLVVAGSDVLDVWDIESRTMLRTVPHPQTEGIASLSVSADGTVAALRAGTDRTVVYNALAGESVVEIQHDAPTSDLAVSPDGQFLAVAQLGGTIEIWDLASEELLQAITSGADDIHLVAWTPDGASLAAVTDVAVVQLWQPGSDEPIWTADSPDSSAGIGLVTRPNALIFSSDGSTLLVDSGAFGAQIRIFDVDDGRQPYPPTLRRSTGATVPGEMLFWRDESALTVVAPGDDDIRVYDLTTGESEPVPATPIGGDWSYSEPLDLIIAPYGAIQLWSLDGSGPLERRVPYSPEQKEALDTFGGNIYTSLSDDASELYISTVALPSTPGAIRLDLDNSDAPGEPISTGLTASTGFGSYTWWGNGGFMQLLDDQEMRALSLDAGELEPFGAPFPFDTSDTAASLDGRFFATSRVGGLVNLYRADGELVEILDMGLPPSFEGIIGVGLSADGELLQATADEFTVMWRTDDLQEVPREIPDDWAFAPLRGYWVFAVLDDGSMQRFDPISLEPVGPPLVGHNAGAGQFVFDESLERLATLGIADGVRVWDLESGEQLGRELPGRPISIELSQDARILTTARDDGVSLWNYDTDAWADIACQAAGRNLTEAEWEAVGPRTIERRTTCPQYPL